MNETPKDSASQPLQKKGFWRRQWQGLRRALIGLMILITLIALVVTEEDWRGKHDWANYRRDLEAKGERFDWQAFVPPAVPDDQNFLRHPFSQIYSVEKSRYPLIQKTIKIILLTLAIGKKTL